MIISSQKIGRASLIFGLVAFLFLGVFGLSHSGMSMDENGQMIMSNCPLMSGHAVVCKMNPLEHIAAWQSMFTSIPQQNSSILISLLLAALAVGFLWPHLRRPPKNDTQAQFFVRRDYVPLASSLQELFSDGILNPKLF